MATDLSKRQKLRCSTINSLNKIIDKAKNAIEKEDFEDTVAYRETMVEKYEKIKNLDQEILGLILDADGDIETEEEKATDFSIYFKKSLRIINNELGKNDIKEAANSTIDTTSSTGSSSYNVKLPRIEIRPFDGSPEKWQTFFEDFQCAIHTRNDISNVQKMTYLRSYLRSSASNAIAALALTNDNYQTAIDLLKERYDNKQLLISTHMKNFLKLERVKDIKNIDALRQV